MDVRNEQVTEYEAWFDTLLPPVRAHEEGEIEELFEAAAMGLLEDSGDARTPLRPIMSEPEVFELRRKALSKQLRFYHGEPPEEPDALVGLHRHIKSSNESQRIGILFAAGIYDSRARPNAE